MLNVENVIDESSEISVAVEVSKLLICRDNSLDVYDDRSDISYEVSDLTLLISLNVSLLRSLISRDNSRDV